MSSSSARRNVCSVDILTDLRKKYEIRQDKHHNRQLRIDHRSISRNEEKAQIQNCMRTLQNSIPIASKEWMIQLLDLSAKKHGISISVDQPDPKGDCAVFLNTDAFYFELVITKTGRCTAVRLDHTDSRVIPVPDLQDALNNGDIERLNKHLAGVSSIYNWVPSRNQKPLVFRSLDSLENDLMMISEIQGFPVNTAYTGSALDCVNQSHVGAITPRHGGIPLRLTYFCSAYDLLDAKQANYMPRTLAGLLSSGEGQSVDVEIAQAGSEYQLPCVPVVRSIGDKNTRRHEYTNPVQSNFVHVEATFVLRLKQPLPVATEIVDQMVKVTGLSKKPLLVGEEKPLVSLIVKHNEQLNKSGDIDVKLEKDEQQDQTDPDKLRLFVRLPEQKHLYWFGSEVNNLRGSMLSYVPFTHVCQVPQLIALLRKQAVFNEMLATCLRPSKNKDESSAFSIELNPASLSLISATFTRPDNDEIATVEFDIRSLSSLFCKLYSVDGQDCGIPTTRIFQRCWSIPVTMRAILIRLQKIRVESGRPEVAPPPPRDQANRQLRQIDETLHFVNLSDFRNLSVKRIPKEQQSPIHMSPIHTMHSYRTMKSPTMPPPATYANPRNASYSPRPTTPQSSTPVNSGSVSPRQDTRSQLLVNLLQERDQSEPHVITKQTYAAQSGGSQSYNTPPTAPPQAAKRKRKRLTKEPSAGSFEEAVPKKGRTQTPEVSSYVASSPTVDQHRRLLSMSPSSTRAAAADPYDFDVSDSDKADADFKAKKVEKERKSSVSTPVRESSPAAEEPKRINTVRIKLSHGEAQVVDSPEVTERPQALKTTIVMEKGKGGKPVSFASIPKGARGRGTAVRGRGRGRGGGERGRKKTRVQSVPSIDLTTEVSVDLTKDNVATSSPAPSTITTKKAEKKKKRKQTSETDGPAESKPRLSSTSGSSSPMQGRVEPSDKGPNAIKITLGGTVVSKVQVVQTPSVKTTQSSKVASNPPKGSSGASNKAISNQQSKLAQSGVKASVQSVGKSTTLAGQKSTTLSSSTPKTPTTQSTASAIAAIKPAPLGKLPKIPKLSDKKKQELQQMESKERSASPLASVDRTSVSSPVTSTPVQCASKSLSTTSLSSSVKKPTPMVNRPQFRSSTPPARLPLGQSGRGRPPMRTPSPRGPPPKEVGKMGVRLPVSGPVKQRSPSQGSSLIRPEIIRAAAPRSDKFGLLPTPQSQQKSALLPTPDRSSPTKQSKSPGSGGSKPQRHKSLTDVIDKLISKGPTTTSVSQAATALLTSLQQAAPKVQPKTLHKGSVSESKPAAAAPSSPPEKAPASPNWQELKASEPVKVIPLSPVSDPTAGKDDVFKAPTPKSSREDRLRHPESPSSASSSPGAVQGLVIDYATTSPVASPAPKSPAASAPSSSKKELQSHSASPSLDSIKSASMASSPGNIDDDLMDAALIGD